MARSLLVLALAASATVGFAGTIAITLQVSAGDEAIEVIAWNEGDEAAVGAQLEAKYRGETWQGELIPTFPPGSAITNTLPFTVGDTAGIYPVVVELHYAESAGAAASAVTCVPVYGPDSERSPVSGRVVPLRICDHAEVETTLVNTSTEDVVGTLRAAFPKEIRAPRDPLDVAVPADGERRIGIPVSNRTASVGSRLFGFLIFEHEVAGVHRTVVLEVPIEIVAETPRTAAKPLVWIGIPAVALAAVIVILTILLGRRSPPTP